MFDSVAVLNSVASLRTWRKSLTGSLALVPTMGALHAGHVALIKEARQAADSVAVSIFVNPLQFGPHEDFAKYPRPFEKDVQECVAAGVDAIFNPSVEEIYPHGQADTFKVIPPTILINRLCGAFRPGHFEGVATVVCKLFNIVQPDSAFFGEKDYQQLQVIKGMVIDLDMPVRVVAVPIVREADGLAMSSRNVYLNSDQRRLAPQLFEILNQVRREAKEGVALADSLQSARLKVRGIEGVTLQYLEACEPDTLQEMHESKFPMVILIAAKYGDIRLIDNLIVPD